MALTKSWEGTEQLASLTPRRQEVQPYRGGLAWLVGASLLVSAGLTLVYRAKTQNFPEISAGLARGELLNLNAVTQSEQLLPFLQFFSDPAKRESAADATFGWLQRSGRIRNVGALARLQMLPLRRLKPLWVVRTPQEYQKEFIRWISIYLSAFYVVYLLWQVRGFRPDPAILPALQLLTGIGLILMISLRDPVRDTLEFQKFAWGVALGCMLLLLPLFRMFSYRQLAERCYAPLFGCFLLFVLLLRFGSGPGGSDAKVNLGPFQPVELIKIFLVLYLAGYFARKWEQLRDLRERWLWRRIHIPRLAHVLPVVCAAGIALALFFVLKDLGPALVICLVFVAMFAMARGRASLALLGVLLMAAGIAAGYRLGKPATVVERIHMWLSPWDNDVRGGNQLSHSYWALSAGGLWGSGPGLGDPEMIPAASTDLILPAIGEELGFAGVATVFLLFAFLVHRALRIALGAKTDHAFFLSFGLASLAAFEMLLISGGVLGAIPLTGVVSPFLSSGNTAMLANFLIFALLLGISHDAGGSGAGKPFERPVRWFQRVLGICALALVTIAAYYQVAHDQEIIARDTRVFEDDGSQAGPTQSTAQ